MTTQQLKVSISDLLVHTEDQEILTLIYALWLKLTGKVNSKIVGYETDGMPISEEEFILSILQSSKEVKEGKVTSHADMKAQFGIYE